MRVSNLYQTQRWYIRSQPMLITRVCSPIRPSHATASIYQLYPHMVLPFNPLSGTSTLGFPPSILTSTSPLSVALYLLQVNTSTTVSPPVNSIPCVVKVYEPPCSPWFVRIVRMVSFRSWITSEVYESTRVQYPRYELWVLEMWFRIWFR